MKNSSSFAPLLTRPSLRDEIDAELASRSLREFVRQAWHIVEPSTPFVPGWHIDTIEEQLEAVTRGQIRNLLINVPPRHMKSLLVCVFAGNVYLPHLQYMPWVNEFIEECAAFPNGARDDQVDAMTQALLRWNMVPDETVVYGWPRVRISPV